MTPLQTYKPGFGVKYSKPLSLLGVMILAFVLLPRAYASPVLVTITPSSQAVPQTSLASYSIGLSSAAKTSYTLTLSGLVPGTAYSFSANPVSTLPGGGTGSGSSTLKVDTSNAPGLYCPGTYAFTVTATNSTSSPVPADPGDSNSASGTLTVLQVGPPLAITVTTDKSTYRIGDKVTIVLTANRPSEVLVTISSPSGPSSFNYIFYGPSYSISKSLTVNAIGRWTVNVQADDFCSGYASGSAAFDVSPDTYDATVSLDGIPAQYSAQLTVDDQAGGAIGGGEIKKLTFKIDTTHTVLVDQYVSGDAGVRYYAAQNSWTVSSGGSHTFEYETQYLLTVATDPDGITSVTGGGWYKAGSTVQTNQVPDTVAGSAGTQYVLKGWEIDGVAQSGNGITVTMDKPHKAVAVYQTQYQLVIDSPYGNPKGQGYYPAGSTVTFSVTSPSGFPIQQIFNGWNGDYTGTSATGSITMDKPMLIHATWSTSYLPLIAIVVVALAVVAGLLFWRTRRGPPAETKPTPAPGETAAAAETTQNITCSKCGTENTAEQKFCTNCGEKLDHRRKHT